MTTDVASRTPADHAVARIIECALAAYAPRGSSRVTGSYGGSGVHACRGDRRTLGRVHVAVRDTAPPLVEIRDGGAAGRIVAHWDEDDGLDRAD